MRYPSTSSSYHSAGGIFKPSSGKKPELVKRDPYDFFLLLYATYINLGFKIAYAHPSKKESEIYIYQRDYLK